MKVEIRQGRRYYSTGFEDGGGGHKPRDLDSLWKLEMARTHILP